MQNTVPFDLAGAPLFVDVDPIQSETTALDACDELLGSGSLGEDLAEHSQAFAAYVSHQQNQWS